MSNKYTERNQFSEFWGAMAGGIIAIAGIIVIVIVAVWMFSAMSG